MATIQEALDKVKQIKELAEKHGSMSSVNVVGHMTTIGRELDEMNEVLDYADARFNEINSSLDEMKRVLDNAEALDQETNQD